MAKKDKEKNLALLDDFSGFMTELLKEDSDRAVAVLASAYLDSLLERLLRSTFNNLNQISSELLDELLTKLKFVSKIELCHKFELINEWTFKDLEIIRLVRNRFAHDLHGRAFTDEDISELCENLGQSTGLQIQQDDRTLKKKFVETTIFLMSSINHRVVKLTQNHVTTKNDPSTR
jgi:DNA-binding MltR family transcriptional regulator